MEGHSLKRYCKCSWLSSKSTLNWQYSKEKSKYNTCTMS